MIGSFRDKETEALWDNGNSRRFGNIARIALRKLYMLHVATTLEELRVPPANRLEALKGSWSGWYSIRINDQWRIVFRWQGKQPIEVGIVDYH
ncbi:type II toxin-antitoxin system RelE/ParE family toxin [Dongia rigui]|uniref:Type II toxin-antitoxin system RelE/ParE family toxin n=1 Tax=Dongia rigui TaxID=940149 RepID=A0ABU5DYS6_9PROT|nr:type II toxin-antitoxin system RelE/ParE family toxin [Dongia rigui]MDY0872468.1 type II toxin-antitoxin system RelE/ParE family toxin [Dongia rigui]